MDKKSLVEQLKKTIEVLESPHIREVEVKYRGMDDADVRVYDVSTHSGKHNYTVRVQDYFDDSTNEMRQDFRCTCVGYSFGSKCRHCLRVRETDAEILGRDLSVEAFQNYNAHLPAKTVLR